MKIFFHRVVTLLFFFTGILCAGGDTVRAIEEIWEISMEKKYARYIEEIEEERERGVCSLRISSNLKEEVIFGAYFVLPREFHSMGKEYFLGATKPISAGKPENKYPLICGPNSYRFIFLYSGRRVEKDMQLLYLDESEHSTKYLKILLDYQVEIDEGAK